MARRARGAVLAGAALAWACGSRSALLEPGTEAGTGGAAGMSGIGAVGTGAAGSGGSVDSGGAGGCTASGPIDPIVVVEHPGATDSEPALIGSSDAERVTVAFVRKHSGSQWGEVRHATLEPWAGWPAGGSLSPTYQTNANVEPVKDFRVGLAGDDQLSALIQYDSGLFFSPAVSVFADGTQTFTSFSDGKPSFVDTRAGRHLIGWTNDSNQLFATIVLNYVSYNHRLACSPQGVVAGAVRHSNDWLVATSNGTTSPKPGCWLTDSAGPPTRLDVARVATTDPELMGGLELSAQVVALAVAPHSSGMYIVWREASGGVALPLRWARFDATKPGFVGPGELSLPETAPSGFSAAALGERLAVAYAAGEPPGIVLEVRDPWGNLVAKTVLQTELSGRLALAASPNGDSLTLAFGGNGEIRLARFDCL